MIPSASPIAEVLLAPGPRPGLPGAEVFAPLVGSWDLVVEDLAVDGAVTTRDGEWHFAWALDGCALVDVWISPSRASRATTGRTEGEWGTSIRFPDPVLGAWRSTWHGPARGWVIPFVAGIEAGGPVLRGERDGTLLRWIFSDVTALGFRWRAEEQEPGGPVRVRQRFTATRRPDEPDA